VDWLDPRADGIRLSIRLTPRARRNAILGIAETADGDRVLKVGVTAAPVGGKANEALIKLLAKHWHLAKSDIRLISGQTARSKVLHITGPATKLETTVRETIVSDLRRSA